MMVPGTMDVPEWVDVDRHDFGATWFVCCSRCESGVILSTALVLETNGKALDDAVHAHLKCEDGDA